jgi:hypothetical protein
VSDKDKARGAREKVVAHAVLCDAHYCPDGDAYGYNGMEKEVTGQDLEYGKGGRCQSRSDVCSLA